MQHLSPYLQQGSDPTREQIGDALRLIRLKCHSRVEAPLLSSSSHVHSPMSASTAPMLSWSSRSPRRASDHTHMPDVAAECLHTSECRCRVCRSDYDALLIKPPQPPEAAYPAMPEHPSPGQEKDRQVGSLEPRLRTALPQASGTQHTGRPTARQVAGLLSEARQPLPPAGVAERAELRCCLSGLFDSAASASSPLTPAPNALPSPSMTLRTTNPLPHASAQTALLEPDEDEDESLASIRSRLARASEKYQKLNEEWLHDLCGVPAPQARSPPVTDSLQPNSHVCTPHSTVRTPHSWAGSGAPGAPAPLLADGTPPAVAPSKESPPAEPPSWADAAAARTSARASALQPAYSQWLAAQTTASLQPQPHRLGDTPSPYQVPTAPLTWEARHETVGKERVISPPKNAASVSPHELRGLRREDDAHDEQLQRVEEELACTEASTCGADEPENGSNSGGGEISQRGRSQDFDKLLAAASSQDAPDALPSGRRCTTDCSPARGESSPGRTLPDLSALPRPTPPTAASIEQIAMSTYPHSDAAAAFRLAAKLATPSSRDGTPSCPASRSRAQRRKLAADRLEAASRQHREILQYLESERQSYDAEPPNTPDTAASPHREAVDETVAKSAHTPGTAASPHRETVEETVAKSAHTPGTAASPHRETVEETVPKSAHTRDYYVSLTLDMVSLLHDLVASAVDSAHHVTSAAPPRASTSPRAQIYPSRDPSPRAPRSHADPIPTPTPHLNAPPSPYATPRRSPLPTRKRSALSRHINDLTRRLHAARAAQAHAPPPRSPRWHAAARLLSPRRRDPSPRASQDLSPRASVKLQRPPRDGEAARPRRTRAFAPREEMERTLDAELQSCRRRRARAEEGEAASSPRGATGAVGQAVVPLVDGAKQDCFHIALPPAYAAGEPRGSPSGVGGGDSDGSQLSSSGELQPTPSGEPREHRERQSTRPNGETAQVAEGKHRQRWETSRADGATEPAPEDSWQRYQRRQEKLASARGSPCSCALVGRTAVPSARGADSLASAEPVNPLLSSSVRKSRRFLSTATLSRGLPITLQRMSSSTPIKRSRAAPLEAEALMASTVHRRSGRRLSQIRSRLYLGRRYKDQASA